VGPALIKDANDLENEDAPVDAVMNNFVDSGSHP